MAESIRVVVTDAHLHNELSANAPPELGVTSAPAEHGFGETLYPILVTAGVASLPVGVISGMIANWIGDTLKARKSRGPETIGIEAGDKIETFTLSDADVERIAQRVAGLISQIPRDDSAS